MGFPYFFHKPDRVEPVAVLHEMNCCAPRRRNYVQFYADKLRPMLGTAEFTITLPKSGAHSFKLCIGVELRQSTNQKLIMYRRQILQRTKAAPFIHKIRPLVIYSTRLVIIPVAVPPVRGKARAVPSTRCRFRIAQSGHCPSRVFAWH